ncbi:MAG: transglutaminase-like domain-containing protein [Bacteroidales bacterium]|nr:transglutaminase-like domain-containing protein [Bacteroidales bacterium]
MSFKLFFAGILTLSSMYLQAKSLPGKAFESYVRKQDSLMVEAYKLRDTLTYNKLLDDFVIRYEQLSKKDKLNFKNYYINAYYNLCCTYSLLNDKPNALLNLEKSITAGYSDYSHLKADSDLDNIRIDAKFISLTNPLRETSDYLYILSKAAQYNPDEKQELPPFTYQSATNPNLVALRKAFNLDSIAGNGNDVSKILNLMYWIHNLVPHDGNHLNPEIKNAMSMIAECKRDNRGLNCRGLVTVLNECYLSMGFKSRFVTCLPKDSLGIDNDCHVINMVYSGQLKKWLWVDPTFSDYVMNEKGELLSIEEVRDRMVNDKPLLLNPDANWNRKVSQTKEDYLYSYMAKNLYILECPLNSEYNAETKEAGKVTAYLQLIPLDYFKKSLEKSESINNLAKTTLVKYKTNNPAVFFQVP